MLQVDLLKSKRILLELVKLLTQGGMQNSINAEKLQQQGKEPDRIGWSHFKEVFMVSALTGN